MPRITDAREAEFAAAAWMRTHGWPDAHVTGSRTENGVDLEAFGAVALVEHHDRPVKKSQMQRLRAVADERRAVAYCFSFAGYHRTAIEWARRVGAGLYRYDANGSVIAVVPIAEHSTPARSAGAASTGSSGDLESRITELTDASTRIIAAIQHRQQEVLTARQRRRVNRARQIILTTTSMLERLDAAYTDGKWRKADRIARDLRRTFARAERLLSS